MTPPIERKITDAQCLAQHLRAARDAGRTVVQCHGCFDLVHPGHVRYLQFARQLGDILVVSLTGDAAVSKGLDRPYIPQELRAENLAALEFVDWVVIDAQPTACELLECLRPDVYVKGREYAGTSDPRFLREQEIVERYGGRVVFHSGDVVFSSTCLIQSLERTPHLDEFRLRAVCQRNAIDLVHTERALDAFTGVRAVVVGDVLREHYVVCDARDAAIDAPVLSLEQLGCTTAWGGAAALAFQLRGLGAEVRLVAPAGDAPGAEALGNALRARGIEHDPLPLRDHLPERRTFVADDAKLFRVDDGACAPLDSNAERVVLERLHAALGDAHLLIWADHGFGIVTNALCTAGTRLARSGNALVAGYAPGPRAEIGGLRDADLLAASERRLREVMHDMASGLPAVAWNLLRSRRAGQVIISLHKRGLIGFDGSATDAQQPPPDRLKGEYFPSFAPHYADLVGSDEAILATAALCLASGAGLPLATYLATAAEALSVVRPGRSVVTSEELRQWTHGRAELRAESRFLPDVATLADIARIAPPITVGTAG